MRIYPEFVFKLNKTGQAPEKLGKFLEAAPLLGYIPSVPASDLMGQLGCEGLHLRSSFMPQKIGLVIDSACDLPRSFIEQQGLEIMPVMMNFSTMTFKDMRDPEQTMDLYRRFVAAKDLEISTTPMSTKAIRDLFLDQLVLKYDRVLVITASSRRSSV